MGSARRPAPRYRNRLGTVSGVQLSEYGSDMRFDRANRDRQLQCNGLVREA